MHVDGVYRSWFSGEVTRPAALTVSVLGGLMAVVSALKKLCRSSGARRPRRASFGWLFAGVSALLLLAARGRRQLDIRDLHHDAERFLGDLARELARVLQLPPPRVVFAPIGNALWDGHAGAVVIDHVWLLDLVARECDSATCNASLTVWLVAHELGHALRRHHLYAGDDVRTLHQQELEADHVAGGAHALLGVDPTGAWRAFARHSVKATRTHPGFTSRRRAFLDGFAYVMRRSVRRSSCS